MSQSLDQTQPFKTLKLGSLQVACYRDVTNGKDGSERSFLKFTFGKRIRNKESGEWQTVRTLYAQDLAGMGALLQAAQAIAFADQETTD